MCSCCCCGFISLPFYVPVVVCLYSWCMSLLTSVAGVDMLRGAYVCPCLAGENSKKIDA